MQNNILDTIIIGAGPAGVSASLYLTRAGMNALVIYKDYGALEKAEKIENFYGAYPFGSGKDLVENAIMQSKELGTKFAKEEVLDVAYDSNFIVTTNKNSYTAKTILIATGSSIKKLDIKNLDTYKGNGVSYCAVCDGFLYRKKEIALIGSSNLAMHELDYLKNLAQKIYLCTNGKNVEIENVENVQLVTDKILSVEKNENAMQINLENNSLSVAGIFVANDTLDASTLAKKMYIKEENGQILVDANMQTNLPNVYAAGDCTKGTKQIYKAVSDGATAAFNIIKNLKTK